MVNHADAVSKPTEPPDEPERPIPDPDDAADWRTDFRSYLDDPE
ncbi:MAG TPA: hypothetical protein VEW95_13930 [Candidatus Limnocylindrales bacterium]|nr:hypothetical protein [Candidatus Limnocylindrales bacterium]